jgi:hypothetical protein
VQVQLEVFLVEADWRSRRGFGVGRLATDLWQLATGHWPLFCGQAVPGQGVVKGLVQVQFADGVAVLVGFGAFDAFAAGAGGDFLVAFALAGAEVGEDLHEGLALHLGYGARGEPEVALAILVEHAVLEQLLEQVGLGVVLGVLHHLLDGFEGLVAILHDEVHELVEAKEVVGGGELRPVVFAVEVLHWTRL